MLGENGHKKVLDLLKMVFSFWGKHAKNVIRDIAGEVKQKKSEQGKKSVKALVRKGRDLELSEPIESKEHLKKICKQCKNQGMAFAVKKTPYGKYQILYQKKDGAALQIATEKVLSQQLKPKNKAKLADILKVFDKSKNDRTKREPMRHRDMEIKIR